MKNWKKAGLTALAGSLVATSAFAGAMTVSGTANITYSAETGKQDSIGTADTDRETGNEGSRWGINKTLSFSGSGELDNGWTISVSQSLNAGSTTGVGLTLDMGDAGSINYEADTGARGIGKIKDMMPTADEDVGNGIDVDGSGTGGGLSGTVSGGTKGFHYTNAVSDMVEIGIGYGHKSAAGAAPGGATGSGATASEVGGYIKLDPMDGLEIGFGVGEGPAGSSDASLTDDYETIYATYVYGNLTVGYQLSNTDTEGSTADDEQTRWGVLYAVNDEMSISYQAHENDDSTVSVDEDAHGISASYTSGGMTFKVHRNVADDVTNTASNESEHTEIGVTFAF
ncbi:MAG: porin [Pelagibacterales bacterium]|nr:porin [Pelagibacterales bacterium]